MSLATVTADHSYQEHTYKTIYYNFNNLNLKK